MDTPNLILVILPTAPLKCISSGDINVESSVFDWLIDEDNRELFGTVEEVNKAMLQKLITFNPFVAVIFLSKRLDAH